MLQCSQITIIGTGLLGASVGLALKAADFRGTVVGLGRRAETLNQAYAFGAVDWWTTDYADALADADMALVAVPLSAFAQVFARIADHGPPHLIVSDVGSTKATVHAEAKAYLGSTQRFLGSHPMAGSEHKGPASARADLFRGKPCIVTAMDEVDPDSAAVVESLWQTLEMNLFRMEAAEHDQKTSVISHMPHVSAALLVQLAIELGGWEIASTGFRDTTRLASSNPAMRADILLANREQVSKSLGQFAEQIQRFQDVLEQGEKNQLLELLESSESARQRWLEDLPRG